MDKTNKTEEPQKSSAVYADNTVAPAGNAPSGSRKRGAVLIAVVVSLMAALLLAYQFKARTGDDHTESVMACTNGSGSAVVDKAIPLMFSNEPQALSASVKDVQAIEGYKKDPRCMYVLVVHYAVIADAVAAKDALKEFNASYEAAKQSADPIAKQSAERLPTVFTVEELDKKVKVAEAQAQELKSNMMFISEPR